MQEVLSKVYHWLVRNSKKFYDTLKYVISLRIIGFTMYWLRGWDQA